MMNNELFFGEARAAVGTDIINFSHLSSFSLGMETVIKEMPQMLIEPHSNSFPLSDLTASPKLILSHTTNMNKVPIRVENISYAQPESICFSPISSCFARGKKNIFEQFEIPRRCCHFIFSKPLATFCSQILLDLKWKRTKVCKYEIPKV
jgi:hypothetical protein